jgi:glycosyltransferase involved in cell wall biosynthesis
MRRLKRAVRRFFIHRIEPLNLDAASLVVVVSEALKRSLVYSGISPSHVLVNPNGVDPEKFRPADSAVCREIRRELGIPEDQIVIGFAGTFGPWHGIPELTETILRIMRHPRWRHRVHFALYGRNSPLREDMERRIRHLEGVVFAGTVEYEKISRYLSICDILLSPHGRPVDGREFFGSPTKLFEYMALGKGIVASDLGQIGRVMEHMETGYLCTPGNVDELVEGIEYFLEHPEEVVRMGQNARDAVMNLYTWERNVDRTIQAFFELRQSGKLGPSRARVR